MISDMNLLTALLWICVLLPTNFVIVLVETSPGLPKLGDCTFNTAIKYARWCEHYGIVPEVIRQGSCYSVNVLGVTVIGLFLIISLFLLIVFIWSIASNMEEGRWEGFVAFALWIAYLSWFSFPVVRAAGNVTDIALRSDIEKMDALLLSIKFVYILVAALFFVIVVLFGALSLRLCPARVTLEQPDPEYVQVHNHLIAHVAAITERFQEAEVVTPTDLRFTVVYSRRIRNIVGIRGLLNRCASFLGGSEYVTSDWSLDEHGQIKTLIQEHDDDRAPYLLSSTMYVRNSNIVGIRLHRRSVCSILACKIRFDDDHELFVSRILFQDLISKFMFLRSDVVSLRESLRRYVTNSGHINIPGSLNRVKEDTILLAEIYLYAVENRFLGGMDGWNGVPGRIQRWPVRYLA